MRLLQRNNDGNYRLAEFVGDAIPRYAILSHTWGADLDEVTLADLDRDTDTTKAGYRKLQFCADQAAKHGLCYFWVDTCCIDKSSSAELTEAINSMFAWYRNAAHCYVYLSDVSIDSFTSGPPAQQDWYPAFQKSRWFTRGWTLQELVAPVSVEFFSVEGQRLGNRYSLLHELHHITGISAEALQGNPLDGFSVDERMSWVGQRKTKREEDIAYSLLGIFDVHMPLIYGEGRRKAFARLQKELNTSSSVELPTRPREPFSTVPFAPDPDFVDRPEILAWICDKCAGPGARAALIGLGGVGKSQIAIRYSHDVSDTSPQMFVFWVHASTKARFEEAYRDIADRLKLPGRENPKADVLQLVRNWLCDETNGQWTMILDNVDDVETFFSVRKCREDKPSGSPSSSLAAYLPQSRNGSILVTSRSKDTAARLVGGHKNTKEVHAMDDKQGLQLLQSKLQDTSIEEGTADLLCALDYMPLAITQAAAYINRRARMTISKYLDEFRRNDKKKQNLLNWDAGDLRRDESASNSVVTTWQMSFERIREERPSAADMLSLMSFFNPQGIPEWILRGYSKNATEASDEDEADSAFDEDLDTLQAYSLITATAETDVCKMHALVQFCTQVWLCSFGAMERWRQEFLGLMAKEFPVGEYEDGEYSYWAKCQGLLLHVESLSEREPTNKGSLKAWAQVLTNITWYITMKGNLDVAYEGAANAVRVREQELGRDHPDTLRSLTVLALALREQGKYDEAERIHRRVLGEREKELGVHHLNTLMSVSNLAVVLNYQGKYLEAEKLIWRALEGREKKLGVQHPDTLMSMNNLAMVLQYQGKYRAAEKMSLQAIEGKEKVLGKEHPDTMSSVSNLAWVMQEQGKYEAAEKMAIRAMEVHERTLGKSHRYTLVSIHNLSTVLQKRGQHEAAEKIHWQALNAIQKALGKEHPETLMSMNNLAWILFDRGKYDEVENMHSLVLEGRKRVLGEEHRETLRSMHSLAVVIQVRGRYGEAEKMHRRALEGRRKALGKEDRDTLTSVDNLGGVLHTKGKYNEAEQLYRDTLTQRQKVLGAEHPDTLTSKNNLADVLQNRGKYEEAEQLY